MYFVDTSAWIAHFDRTDSNHEAAVRFVRRLDRPLLTTNYVLDEVITLARRRLGHTAAVTLATTILEQKAARLVRILPEDEEEAWQLFVRYEDKTLSFTDCTSFAIMRRLNLREAFTFDHHFTQLGFLRVPASRVVP